MMLRILRVILGLALLNVVAGTALFGQYWPAYGEQKPRDLDWSRTDIGYYFVTETNTTGFRIPAIQSEAGAKDFVSAAKAIATSGNRKAFIKDVKSFLNKYKFDGVDFDWEFPGSQGIGCNKVQPEDSANFLTFLKALRLEIGSSKLITAAIATPGLISPDGNPLADMSGFGKVFDILNLMTYDVGGPWEPTSGPNCPLRTCKSVTGIVEVIDTFKKAGIPASKMMLGIPAYGYSYKLKSSKLKSQKIGGFTSQVYQDKTEVIPKGNRTDSNTPIVDVCGVRTASYTGMWNYVDLIDEGLLSSNGKVGLKGWTRHVDACSATPFLFNPKTKVMINYDDAYSAGEKTKYALAQGLKGVYTFDSTGFSADVLGTIRKKLDA
ncbi:BQ2448_4740 [Microbotryum intermedium]|uniref:BQ2448_4740 protein n=1 Tax=Microbotryum intermedium TaxID=269621 RepID=A0A238FLT8_9BASI|nr:BQ2448_4740 [Microbotryum intermedium]